MNWVASCSENGSKAAAWALAAGTVSFLQHESGRRTVKTHFLGKTDLIETLKMVQDQQDAILRRCHAEFGSCLHKQRNRNLMCAAEQKSGAVI